MRSIFFAALVSFVAVGCGGDSKPGPDNDPFASFQACYDDHHGDEGFSTPCAVEICCIDHPIGSTAMNVVCGDTQASCMTYVMQNLTDAADTTLMDDITAACGHYLFDSERSTTGSGGMCSG